jgi:CelD/BcsL family acetyltransferase involved in cellulose biosynthesis
VRVEVNDDAFGSLRAAWSTLFAADPCATPFLAPGFGEAWLRHWAGHVSQYAIVVRDGSALVGLAPLVLRRRGPIRTLLPLGHYVANYWDVLARPERRRQVAEAVASELARRRGDWEALSLDTVPAGSLLAAELARAGLRLRGRGSRPYPGLSLPATFDDYLAGLRRRHRTDLRRHLRPLDRGELQLQEIREPAALDAAVAHWRHLRERWWSARGKELNPDHTRPEFAAFLRAMLRELVPAGPAVAWELRDGKRLLGVSFNLRDDRTFYFWLSAFHPDVARLGPGKLVIAESIRRSIAAGLGYFDFMVGAEPYKYDFGAVDRHVPRLLVGSATARSDAALAGALALGRLRAV